jgi:hypothetical protein
MSKKSKKLVVENTAPKIDIENVVNVNPSEMTVDMFLANIAPSMTVTLENPFHRTPNRIVKPHLIHAVIVDHDNDIIIMNVKKCIYTLTTKQFKTLYVKNDNRTSSIKFDADKMRDHVRRYPADAAICADLLATYPA